jgi:DNA adenine methylase
MMYFGGKAKIAKPLAEFLQGQLKEGQVFVDMFCGSCNVVSKIKADVRIANDLNKYLVSMWYSLQHGW